MAYFEKLSIAGNIANTQGPDNSGAQTVKTIDSIDGASLVEVMSAILLELRILNQQMYELPGLIAQGIPSPDEPQAFRLEQSVFNI